MDLYNDLHIIYSFTKFNRDAAYNYGDVYTKTCAHLLVLMVFPGTNCGELQLLSHYSASLTGVAQYGRENDGNKEEAQQNPRVFDWAAVARLLP